MEDITGAIHLVQQVLQYSVQNYTLCGSAHLFLKMGIKDQKFSKTISRRLKVVSFAQWQNVSFVFLASEDGFFEKPLDKY